MILALILNIAIVGKDDGLIYVLLLVGQLAFYGSAYLGKVMEDKKVRVKLLFIPYYFCMMNYAVFAGILRYFRGNQSVIWEKAVRK